MSLRALSGVALTCVALLFHGEPAPESGSHAASPTRASSGDATIASCLRSWPEGCDVRAEACQERVFAVVRCLGGTTDSDFRPRVRFVEPEGMAAERERLSRTRDDRERLRAAALSWIGLHREPAQEAAGVPTRLAGFYSYATREILINDVPAADAFALAHEYVHALQDRSGALGRAALAWTTLDEQLARRATLEGEASLYEELLRARYQQQSLDAWVERFRRRLDSAQRLAAAAPSALDASTANFVYPYGAAYVASFERNGLQLLTPAWHLAPERAATGQLVARSVGEELAPPAAMQPGPEAFESLRLRHADTVGAWMTGVLATRLARSLDSGAEAFRAYRGDWLGFYTEHTGVPGPEARGVVYWKIVWSDARAATRAAAELEKLDAPPAGARSVTLLDRSTLVLAGSTREELSAVESRILPASH